MRTITESVEAILRESPSLAEALSEGIVNYSALARRLKPELEEEHLKTFTEGAIIMALKRLQRGTPASRSKKKIESLVRSISVRSHLIEYAFQNSVALPKIEGQLLRLTENDDDVYVYVTRGMFDTAFIVSKNIEEKLKTLTKDEKRIKRFEDLSAVGIRFKQEITDIPGVYYPFFQALAWRGINFVQVITGFAELIFLFADKDVDRAFAVLKSVTKN